MLVAARRPHFAAGVALVGATVIAASAVTPMPAIHLPNIDLPVVHGVDLAALANPLEIYSQVFQSALANTNTLVQNTVPGQLLNQILQNQVGSAATLLNGLATTGGGIAAAASQVPAALTTAVSQLAAGNVEGAVNTLLGIPLNVITPATGLFPVLQAVLTQPLTNLINVVNAFTRDAQSTLLAVSGFIAPLISTPAAAAVAIQNVINAVGTGDLGAVANAVLAAPATIVDGLLNGGYGPNLGPLAGLPEGSGVIVKAGGLLSSSEATLDENGNVVVTTGGPFAALQQVIKMITDAITPPTAPVAATAAIASIPTVKPATVTLTTVATDPAKTATTDTAQTATTDTATDAASPKPASDSAPEKPAATADETKEPAAVAEGTAAATKDPTTKEPTTIKKPTITAPTTKVPTVSGVDVTTGNKVEPKTPTGSDAPTSVGSSTPTADTGAGSTEQAAGSTATAGGGTEKGIEKSAEKSSAA